MSQPALFSLASVLFLATGLLTACSGPQPAPTPPEPDQNQMVEYDTADPATADIGLLPVLTIELFGERHPLPLRSTHVEARLLPHAALVTVEQTFRNDFPDQIDANYTFPLPTDAIVTGLQLWLNGHPVAEGDHGSIHDAYRAGFIEGRLTLLLERARPDIVNAGLTNVPPRSDIKVRTTFTQPHLPSDDEYEWRMPTVVAPRAEAAARMPPNYTFSRGDTPLKKVLKLAPRMLEGFDSGHRISFDIQVEGVGEIEEFDVPTHDAQVALDGNSADITVDEAKASRDLVLRYAITRSEMGGTVFVQPDEASDTQELAETGTFLLVADSPYEASPDEAPEVLLVIDASPSMKGKPLEVAVSTAANILRGLQDNARFNIVTLTRDPEVWWDSPVRNTRAQREKALSRLETLEVADARPDLPGALRQLKDDNVGMDDAQLGSGQTIDVVLLSDGLDEEHNALVKEVIDWPDGLRLHTVAVGSAPNHCTLRMLANETHGSALSASEWEGTVRVASTLVERLGMPVLRRVSLAWEGVEVERMATSWFPALYAGSPIVVSGRYRGEVEGSVPILVGRSGGESVMIPLEVSVQPVDSGLDMLWARERLEALGYDPRSNRASREERQELSEDYFFLRPGHGLFAEAPAPATCGGFPGDVMQPVEQPAGTAAEGLQAETPPAELFIGEEASSDEDGDGFRAIGDWCPEYPEGSDRMIPPLNGVADYDGCPDSWNTIQPDIRLVFTEVRFEDGLPNTADLDRLALELEDVKPVRFELTGVDPDGKAKRARALAEVVKAALVERGVPGKTLVVEGRESGGPAVVNGRLLEAWEGYPPMRTWVERSRSQPVRSCHGSWIGKPIPAIWRQVGSAEVTVNIGVDLESRELMDVVMPESYLAEVNELEAEVEDCLELVFTDEETLGFQSIHRVTREMDVTSSFDLEELGTSQRAGFEECVEEAMLGWWIFPEGVEEVEIEARGSLRREYR